MGTGSLSAGGGVSGARLGQLELPLAGQASLYRWQNGNYRTDIRGARDRITPFMQPSKRPENCSTCITNDFHDLDILLKNNVLMKIWPEHLARHLVILQFFQFSVCPRYRSAFSIVVSCIKAKSLYFLA